MKCAGAYSSLLQHLLHSFRKLIIKALLNFSSPKGAMNCWLFPPGWTLVFLALRVSSGKARWQLLRSESQRGECSCGGYLNSAIHTADSTFAINLWLLQYLSSSAPYSSRTIASLGKSASSSLAGSCSSSWRWRKPFVLFHKVANHDPWIL